jgi:hypothetical protein
MAETRGNSLVAAISGLVPVGLRNDRTGATLPDAEPEDRSRPWPIPVIRRAKNAAFAAPVCGSDVQRRSRSLLALGAGGNAMEVGFAAS